MNRTLVIDGNHLAHRCRHVFSLTYKGEDVSVTYGFLSVLKSMLKRFKPTSVMVCWDGGIPDFRRNTLPEYKSNRDHGDPLAYEDFCRQVDELETYVLPMMGIVSVRRPQAEGDDLVYHASRLLVGDVIVVSGDKDLFQCIGDGVTVYNPNKEAIYDAQMVKEEIGVDISKYVDWRALQGDNSDNIPGVPGIGGKTATKLFAQFGTLTGIVNAALGINPAGVLQGKVADAIRAFGFGRIAKNIYVTALYADRVGARRAVIEACANYSESSISTAKRYLYSKQFVSLADASFLGPISKLAQPKLRTSGMRIPVVPCKRKPVI